MKFPKSEFDRQEYLKKIYELLEDDECIIFIDTNIIALLYRIYDSARKEFFDWISVLIKKERVKTPLWVLNEYTNHFIRNKTEDYLSPLKIINTVNKDFLEVSTFLKMNIDKTSLSGSKYNDLNFFLSDLELVKEKLKDITVTAKSKNENYKLKIHDEIQNHFEKTVLNSPLDDIFSKIINFGEVRYNHKFPPGFQDEGKNLNPHGDLIIWNEILDYCENEKVKKAILITNDEKKDWVYAPNRIIDNSRSVVNKVPQLKIADPRLVYEFKLKTSSEEFYIITFDLLTQILIQNSKVSFVQLANALQVAHKQNIDQDEECEDETFADSNLSHQDIQEKIEETEPFIPLEPNDANTDRYSQSALADSQFELYDESFLTTTIINLKTHNWYVQNPALELFLSSNINSIEENKENDDKLFVIGRNIYQAACGSSSVAVDFIKNLNTKFLAKFNEYILNHIYSGLLYEIYFDSNNNFRDDLKSNYINEVLNLKSILKLKPSIEFINEKISPFKSQLLYYPTQNNDKVILEITLDTKTIKEEDWRGTTTEYKEILSIKANKTDLLTLDHNESLETYYPRMNIKGLISFICVNYAIPENQLEISNTDLLKEQAYITFSDKKLKKLANIKIN